MGQVLNKRHKFLTLNQQCMIKSLPIVQTVQGCTIEILNLKTL
jgi:hypothetical protein